MRCGIVPEWTGNLEVNCRKQALALIDLSMSETAMLRQLRHLPIRRNSDNFLFADYSSRMLESAAHRRTADSESLGVMRPSKVAKAPMREAPQSTVRCLTLIDVPS